MYFNTANETGEALSSFTLTAETQDEAVLELMKKHRKLSPSQCHRKYMLGTGKSNTPLTSIRRSISNLTNQGLLVQTDEKMRGSYGRNEYFWRIA